MLTTLLLILAIISFILAAASVRGPWVPVGLALVTLTLLLPHLGVAA